MRSRTEFSAGGVVVAEHDGRLEVALASRRTRSGELAWGLPKGLVEPGEEPEAAAVREVREETGLEATIRSFLGDANYTYVWDQVLVRKRVASIRKNATRFLTSTWSHT